MGYLKCKSCGGRYDLEPGESPDDFVRCQCGGELEFYDDQGTKREYGSVSGKKGSKMHPALMILVALVLGYLLFGYVFSWSILLLFKLLDLIGPAGGIIFFGICLAAILGMIWYGFKKR